MLQAGASLTGWGAAFQGKSTGETWSFQESKWHISDFELLAVKPALQTFLKNQNVTSIRIENGQHSGSEIFEKNGGNQESENHYTVKRDLGNINFRTDHDYCWVPTHLTRQSGGLGILSQSDLIRIGPLLTCLSQSLPEVRSPNSRFIRLKGVTASSTICCMETKSLQHSNGRNGNSWDTGSLLRISPILSDRSYTKQNTTRPSAHSNNDNNTLLSYPQVLGMLIRRPVLIPSSTTLLVDPKGNPHPLVLNKALMLVAWQVSRKNCLSSEFLTKQISLSPSQEGKVLWEITNRPGRSGLAGVTHGKLTHFNALWIMFYSIMNSFYTEQ